MKKKIVAIALTLSTLACPVSCFAEAADHVELIKTQCSDAEVCTDLEAVIVSKDNRKANHCKNLTVEFNSSTNQVEVFMDGVSAGKVNAVKEGKFKKVAKLLGKSGFKISKFAISKVVRATETIVAGFIGGALTVGVLVIGFQAGVDRKFAAKVAEIFNLLHDCLKGQCNVDGATASANLGKIFRNVSLPRIENV